MDSLLLDLSSSMLSNALFSTYAYIVGGHITFSKQGGRGIVWLNLHGSLGRFQMEGDTWANLGLIISHYLCTITYLFQGF